jgi:hypothetical protein
MSAIRITIAGIAIADGAAAREAVSPHRLCYDDKDR